MTSIDDLPADAFAAEVERAQTHLPSFLTERSMAMFDRLVREWRERGERLKWLEDWRDAVIKIADLVYDMDDDYSAASFECAVKQVESDMAMRAEYQQKAETERDALAAQLAEAKAEITRLKRMDELCHGKH